MATHPFNPNGPPRRAPMDGVGFKHFPEPSVIRQPDATPDEIGVMQACCDALQHLEDDARRRVLAYITARFIPF